MANVVLKVEGLTKCYGTLTAVKALTLEVYEGEVFGFLGPNGAGKTTTIRMMCGLLKPDAGRVLIHGQPVSGVDGGVKARVGMCPQETVLWERLTCLEQLQFIGEMYGLKGQAARQRGERLLAALGLSEKRDQLARTLSGGMQRRLNLAMALVHDPDIVILDEPEAGLDPQSRVQVREYVRSIARQKTVILTTHNMDEAERLADRVAIIDYGELLVLDTPVALKRRVGQGDVVEIHLSDGQGDAARAALLAAKKATRLPLGEQATLDATSDALVVRALNAVGVLPAILETLNAAGITCSEVRLRENTLEDVFIQLTGRKLRE